MTEAFGVFYAALYAANTGQGACIFKHIAVVVVFKPNNLTFMLGQHLKFKLELIGNVYILGRLAIYTVVVFHIEKRCYLASRA